jgi:NhaP-type Na+/H+ or K+/H+ antiporter
VNFEEQILMAYGGLRGAIAFSLVQLLDKQERNKIGVDNMIVKNTRLFQTTTLFVIMFTVIVLVG